MHAKPLKLGVSSKISEIKGRYRDKMPLLFG